MLGGATVGGALGYWLGGRNTVSSEELSKANAEIANLKQKLDAFSSSEATINQLTQEKQKLQNDLDAEKQKVTQKDQTITDLNNQISNLNTGDKDAKIIELTNKNNNLQGQVTNLTDENNDLKTQITNLTNENNELKSKLLIKEKDVKEDDGEEKEEKIEFKIVAKDVEGAGGEIEEGEIEEGEIIEEHD